MYISRSGEPGNEAMGVSPAVTLVLCHGMGASTWNGSHRIGFVLDCRKTQVNHCGMEWKFDHGMGASVLHRIFSYVPVL